MLRARVLACGGPEMASTFRNLEEAERAVSQVMRSQRRSIQLWAQKVAASAHSVPPQAFEASLGRMVGSGVHRQGKQLLHLSKVRGFCTTSSTKACRTTS